ncbi:MFS general substrate transporter [Ascobolus immersus RN42]|uniref:MFS general substrate transporter n=1 Tax=Ascobolus immersus RN42 TaxID=1160509 RepID=A0A3N4HZ11_ASCIM|nr:MFS general substrate transporter [Ascobolus immersus RN42]
MATIRNRVTDEPREDTPVSPSHVAPEIKTSSTIRAYFPAVLLFMSELFELLLVVPKIRLLEAKICRNYYDLNDPSVYNPDGTIPELLCKIPEIQARLAHIKGWQVFWEGLPVMLLAIPWGILADRVGRRKVLALNFFGCIVSVFWFLAVCTPGSTLPAEAVWGSGFANLIGGGPRVGSVLILALVSDNSPETKRSQRFYFTYSAYLIAELIAPPFAGLLMRFSIWLTFWVALGALFFAYPVLLATKEQTKSEREGRMKDDDEDSEALLATENTPLPTSKNSKISEVLWKIKTAISKRTILLVLLGHFCCPVRIELVFQTLIPYASKVYSLTIANAGLLLSIVAATNLVVFLVGLPYITHRLRTRFGYKPVSIDVFVARGSCFVLAVGSFIMAIAPHFSVFILGTIVFASGFGIRLSLLSILTGLVDPKVLASVYTVVTLVEGFGEMVAAPVLQESFAFGLRKGSTAVAAPWVIGLVVYTGAFFLLGRIKTMV